MNNKDAADFLEEGANLWRERNAVYGNSYHSHGAVMLALFPRGIKLFTAEDHRRFGVLTMIISKLGRYCIQFPQRHNDSIADLKVYAAMLEELDQ